MANSSFSCVGDSAPTSRAYEEGAQWHMFDWFLHGKYKWVIQSKEE